RLLYLVKNHQSQQERQVQNRNEKQLPLARQRQVSRKLNRVPQKRQPQHQRPGQVNRPRQLKQKRAETNRQQPQRVADRLASRARALRIDERQHLEAAPGVIFAIHPRNRQEMRQLPKSQNGEQRPSF